MNPALMDNHEIRQKSADKLQSAIPHLNDKQLENLSSLAEHLAELNRVAWSNLVTR